MVQRYPYSTRWENNIVANIHIYGAGAIFYSFMITKTLNLNKEK